MFTVRPIERDDAAACTDILNHTIRIGGTTAYEKPFTVEGFDKYYRIDAALCFVVESDQEVVGFQGLFDVGDRVLSVGSFTDQRHPKKGAGRALIAQSANSARDHGFSSIIAKITSDNAAGLSYYAKSGFVDDHVIKNDHQRPNGVWVDRIVKRLVL